MSERCCDVHQLHYGASMHLQSCKLLVSKEYDVKTGRNNY